MIGGYHYLSIDGMCNHLILSMVERVVHPATYSNSYKLLLYPSTHLTEEPFLLALQMNPPLICFCTAILFNPSCYKVGFFMHFRYSMP